MNFEDYVNKKPYASRKENKEVNDAYNDEEVRLYSQFKHDLFADLGISNHPKR